MVSKISSTPRSGSHTILRERRVHYFSSGTTKPGQNFNHTSYSCRVFVVKSINRKLHLCFFCTRQSRLIKEFKVRFFYKIFANFATQWVFLCSKIITTTYHRISALYKFSIIYFIIIKNWNMLRLCHVWNDFNRSSAVERISYEMANLRSQLYSVKCIVLWWTNHWSW